MTFRHLSALLAEVEPLGLRFAASGHRLFLVGGIVRDLWLDAPLEAVSDLDLTTDARPEEIRRIVAPIADHLWLQGEKFGTIGMRAWGRDFEITTHRSEYYRSDSRKPEVNFGDDVSVDLSRRDFTVNAMALSLPEGELVDPWGGAEDLAAGVLRTPLRADVSFGDDPLRMLRAARFASKLSLVPTREVVDCATELRERIRIVAIERIGVELTQLLGLADPTPGVGFLVATGLLAELLSFGEPERLAEVRLRQDRAAAVVGRVTGGWETRLAAVAIAAFDDDVAALCRRLRLSRADEGTVVRIARAARAVQRLEDTANPSHLRRWCAATQPEHRQAALAVARALDPGGARVEAFVEGLTQLARREDLDAVALLSGQQIMAALAIEAGPAVGHATRFLENQYFERGPLSIDEQIAAVRDWWTDRVSNA